MELIGFREVTRRQPRRVVDEERLLGLSAGWVHSPDAQAREPTARSRRQIPLVAVVEHAVVQRVAAVALQRIEVEP